MHLEPEVLKQKQPRFDTNDRFDFSVFGVKFDIVVARSIWSHSSKAQIQIMLDQFAANSSPDGIFLTSYYPAHLFFGKRDYQGGQWIGKSHQCDKPGQVYHKFSWIQQHVESRGMFVRQLPDLVFNGQYWLKIARNPAALEQGSYKFD